MYINNKAYFKIFFCLTIFFSYFFFTNQFAVAKDKPIFIENYSHLQTVNDGLFLMKNSLDNNQCVLSFDDGPSKYTKELLKTLNDYNVPAVFFIIGKKALRYKDEVMEIINQGHEIGNHSFEHNYLVGEPLEVQLKSYKKTDTILKELGAKIKFLRPPFGKYDKKTVEIAKILNSLIVLWSVDSKDWQAEADFHNMQTVANGFPLRGIFLFHDTKYNTVKNMPAILDYLIGNGCNFTSLSASLNLDSNENIKISENNKVIGKEND